MENRIYRVIPDFNSMCRKCSLSTKCALGGHAFQPIQNTELIIVSAYPGREEIVKGYSLAPNEKKETMDTMNAGRYLKSALIYVFDLDPNFPQELKPFYKFCTYTNIVKCSPVLGRERKDVTDKHVNICKDWLELEIQTVAKQNPYIPLLLSGSEASKLLGKDMTVYAHRRKIHYYKDRHPSVITFNFIEGVKYSHRTLKDYKISADGSLRVKDIGYWKPAPFGSIPWHLLKDLELTKKLVLENYYRRKEV